MELLIAVVFLWLYIVIGIVLVAADIEPFDVESRDYGDSDCAKILFWPGVLIRAWYRRRCDAKKSGASQ